MSTGSVHFCKNRLPVQKSLRAIEFDNLPSIKQKNFIIALDKTKSMQYRQDGPVSEVFANHILYDSLDVMVKAGLTLE